MKIKLLLGALFLVLLTVPVTADGYTNGTVEDGYTYKDGYWYYHYNPYTRTRVTTPGYTYYSCGRCYQTTPTYSYNYTLYTGTVAPAYVAPAPLPTYTDSGWRSKLLDIAAQRDKQELALRHLAVEQAAYVDSLNALGLNGNFRINGYGQYLPYPQGNYKAVGVYNSGYNPGYNLGNYGVNGNTQYGYTYQTIKEAYGETNMNTLYQQADRHTAAARQLAGQANTEFSDLVAAAGNNQARIAEILAKARAAEIALRAAEPQAAVKTTTTVVGSGTTTTGGTGTGTGTGNPPVSPGTDDPSAVRDSAAFLKTVGIPLCGQCHSGQNLKGKFDIMTYPNMTPAQKAVVWDRLTTSDNDKVMPRTADGKSSRLPPAVVKEFFTH